VIVVEIDFYMRQGLEVSEVIYEELFCCPVAIREKAGAAR
jgi:hypothetical protein